jgi:hypothetical protein
MNLALLHALAKEIEGCACRLQKAGTSQGGPIAPEIRRLEHCIALLSEDLNNSETIERLRAAGADSMNEHAIQVLCRLANGEAWDYQDDSPDRLALTELFQARLVECYAAGADRVTYKINTAGMAAAQAVRIARALP